MSVTMFILFTLAAICVMLIEMCIAWKLALRIPPFLSSLIISSTFGLYIYFALTIGKN